MGFSLDYLCIIAHHRPVSGYDGHFKNWIFIHTFGMVDKEALS
jgi:hypothetical protein